MNVLLELKRANPERCKAFGHTVQSMPVLYWATATGGEVGELLNLIKKKERGDDIQIKQIADECADVVIYLDLLCNKLGIDLGNAIAEKFNEVSVKVKSNIFIGL